MAQRHVTSMSGDKLGFQRVVLFEKRVRVRATIDPVRERLTAEITVDRCATCCPEDIPIFEQSHLPDGGNHQLASALDVNRLVRIKQITVAETAHLALDLRVVLSTI